MTQATPVRRVAVRGDDDVADRLDEAGVTVCDLETADAVVTVGEEALLGAALSNPGIPLLPVAIDEGHHAVSKQALGAASDALATGDYRTVSHPVLGVTVDGERVGRAVLDVTLMTTEPARISEYGIHADGETLDTVRADGVVVATPLGSSGYARAAGGPVLAPDAGLTVVPVAPFATRADTWVVDDAVDLTVERDEGDVSLYADTERVRSVDPHTAVSVGPVSAFQYLRPSIDE